MILNAAGYLAFTSNGFFVSDGGRLEDDAVHGRHAHQRHLDPGTVRVPLHISLLSGRVRMFPRTGSLYSKRLSTKRYRRMDRYVASVFVFWNLVAFLDIYWMFHPPPEFQAKGLQV